MALSFFWSHFSECKAMKHHESLISSDFNLINSTVEIVERTLFLVTMLFPPKSAPEILSYCFTYLMYCLLHSINYLLQIWWLLKTFLFEYFCYYQIFFQDQIIHTLLSSSHHYKYFLFMFMFAPLWQFPPMLN